MVSVTSMSPAGLTDMKESKLRMRSPPSAWAANGNRMNKATRSRFIPW